jgi:endonuclease YncB( thermonuclease family)
MNPALRNPIMKIGIAMALLIGLYAAPARSEIVGTAEAIDGQTIRVNDDLLPLYGIESVAVGTVCRDDSSEWRCGTEIRDAFSNWLKGDTVRCEAPQGNGSGMLCHRGETNVSAWLVEQGWARSIPQKLFSAEQRDAMAANRGLWRDGFSPAQGWRIEAILEQGACDVCAARRRSALRNRETGSDE